MWKRTGCRVLGCAVGSQATLNVFADKTFLQSPNRTGCPRTPRAGRFPNIPWHLAVDCETRKPRGHIENLRLVVESPGSPPRLKWDTAGNVPFYVKVIQEDVGPQKSDKLHTAFHVDSPTGGRLFVERDLEGLEEGGLYRVEVSAVSNWAPLCLKKEVVRLLAVKHEAPDSKEAAESWKHNVESMLPFFNEFLKQNGRPLRILVVGKQHHGKSSHVNHMNRFLRQDMSRPDIAKAAPAGELETTKRVQCAKIPIKDCKSEDGTQHSVVLYDSPAFQTMNEDRVKDLKTLENGVHENWGLGDDSRFRSEKPDSIIVVVSLIDWRDERDSLKAWLQRCQEAIALPFVVVATHKDKFISEQGNKGVNPKEAVKEAVQDLQEMANTNQVIAMSNYHADSWWTPSVDKEVVKMIRQLLMSSTKG